MLGVVVRQIDWASVILWASVIVAGVVCFWASRAMSNLVRLDAETLRLVDDRDPRSLCVRSWWRRRRDRAAWRRSFIAGAVRQRVVGRFPRGPLVVRGPDSGAEDPVFVPEGLLGHAGLVPPAHEPFPADRACPPRTGQVSSHG